MFKFKPIKLNLREKFRGCGKSVVKFLRQMRIKLHALVVLLLVLWAGYLGVSYLIRFVFLPARVPDRFVNNPLRLEAQDLYRPQVPGITTTSARSPLGHYHQVDQWFQPDPLNGCTAEGCHSPMPHRKNKAIRAFNNFHATFLSCQMCHMTKEEQPQAIWVSTATGRRQEAPDILQLMNFLAQKPEKINAAPAQAHQEIIRRLNNILAINSDPVLQALLVRIDTAEPGSPVWRQACAQLVTELPLHARGEYGAKLMPVSDQVYQAKDELLVLRQREELLQLVKACLAEIPGSTQRRQIRKQIHEGRREEAQNCLACHGAEKRLLDFGQLGYPADRVEKLLNSPIARQMAQIQQGKEFYLTPHTGVVPSK